MKKPEKKRVLFVDGEQSMEAVVMLMRDHNISSVLVSNAQRQVIGIITERDIVQKFTLLEKSDKLSAKAAAFMSRPVRFARLDFLEEDTRQLLFEGKLRHFPITSGTGLQVANVVGMLTVTDLARNSFLHEHASVAARRIVVLAPIVTQRVLYRKLFETLNFSVIDQGEAPDLFAQAAMGRWPVVCDLDGLDLEGAKEQLLSLKKFAGMFLLLSSDDRLVDQLKVLMQTERHVIAKKPLDMSLILKVLRNIEK